MKDPIAPEIQGAAAVVDPPLEADYGGDAKLNRGGLAWALFQGGRDPIVILIIIYVFMPYVAGCGEYRRECEEVVAGGYSGFLLGRPSTVSGGANA